MNENKKILFSIIGIFLLIIATIVGTYAYFSASTSNNNTIEGNTSGVDLDLEVNKISTSATGALIPLDNDISSLTNAAKGYGFSGTEYDASKSCIDMNNYTVCQVYEVIISNNASSSIILDGGVTVLEGNDNPNIACAVMNTNISVTSNASCVGSNAIANNITLNGNSSKTYYIIVYINNLNEEQYDTGSFTGTIVFNSMGGKVTAAFSS